LLILSLALNLLIFGAIAGAGLARRSSIMLGQPGGEGGVAPFLQYMQQLEPQRRAELRRLIVNRRGDLLTLRRDVRRARIAAARTVTADTFDAAAFKAAQDRVIEAERAIRVAQTELQASVLSQLTTTERRDFMGWRNRQRVLSGRQPDDAEEPKAE
jgi:uncharacterized membrane protein